MDAEHPQHLAVVSALALAVTLALGAVLTAPDAPAGPAPQAHASVSSP